jgi:6,7-dimethyl-8-ribityllumazine synthase
MTKTTEKSWRIAIVVSRFNEGVTGGLKQGALTYLSERGIRVDEAHIFSAPGAFEIPLLAQSLAESGKFDGVVCLGCVIKGDTAHFEFISLGATMGLMQSMLATRIPLAFGIITTYTEEQAEARSRNDAHNKGREAAAACIEALEILGRIKALS